MAIISLTEIFNILLMIAALGFIFKDSFKSHPRHDEEYDPLTANTYWDGLIEACILTAPAIVLHEMAHKAAGMALGLTSIFEASYPGLLLGILLKVFNSPIMFLIPGYVIIQGGSSMDIMITSVAGPLMNGLLWVIASIMLSRSSTMSVKAYHRWVLTKNINGFLFVLNMIPIPGFDGYNFFTNLWTTFF